MEKQRPRISPMLAQSHTDYEYQSQGSNLYKKLLNTAAWRIHSSHGRSEILVLEQLLGSPGPSNIGFRHLIRSDIYSSKFLNTLAIPFFSLLQGYPG